jgi:hypothetical protein
MNETSRSRELNIAVVGIVKDVESTIYLDYSRIKQSLSKFKTCKWFLVESNSTDASLKILSNISLEDPDFHFATMMNAEETDQPRTIAMAKARNRYLQEIRENEEFSDVDFVVIADFNGLNNLLSSDSVESCFKRDDWDACFANQTKRYYDIWALRHPLWSPNDCWSQHAFFRDFSKIPEASLYSSVQSRMIHIPPNANWIEVDSAFGGFGIYRKTTLADGSYSGLTEDGMAICEHVPLNLFLRKKGFKLFVNPSLINSDSTDHSENAFVIKILKRISLYPIKYLKTLTRKV